MSAVQEIVRLEIQKNGVLPFARFMELALHCPEHGYYETKMDIGRRGDFYTSVSAGELFGQMLAFQFSNWLEESRIADRGLRIVEAGAHDGRLAGDILTWLQLHRPGLFQEAEYAIIEPSKRRREWQMETLKDFAPRVRWLSGFNESTIQRFHGVVFSNELLDSFAVHRFGWDAKEKKWFEWGVAVDGDKFLWTKIRNPQSPIINPQLEAVLPDGYTIETSPAAEAWWREAAAVLERGWLMTLDYGLTNEELLSPARPRGTLRAYSRHHVSDDVLANPGEQDLTAHVNFSAIQRAGEDCGLKTAFFGSQAKFLTEILAAADKTKSLGEWSAKKARQFQTLTHPEHLGRAFRVLVQSR